MMRFVFAVLILFAALPARAVDIKEVVSPGGIKAWLVQEPSIPMIAIDIMFKGGATLDPDDAQGATYMMMGMLEEGAGDLDATAFRQSTETLAARFAYDTNRDSVSISAEILRENADVAIDLLRLALIEPQFNDVAMARVKTQILSGLRSDATDPNAQAGLAFRSDLFGDHPYGRAIEGTLASVEALSREDLFRAHREALAKDDMYVGVVGDISETELGVMLDRLLGDLPESGAVPKAAPTVKTDGAVKVIQMPVPQSVVLFGHEGIERDDPDFFAAYVMNHILGGGGFSSRLTVEVREKRGLTYGVYSYLAPSDLAALYLGSFASANNRVAEAISVLQDEWTRMRDNGATPEELNNAKRYLTGAYPLRFDSNVKIARIMSGLQYARVARRVLKPESLNVVVVGQPEGL